MKKIALTVAVLALGLAACEDDHRDRPRSNTVTDQPTTGEGGDQPQEIPGA